MPSSKTQDQTLMGRLQQLQVRYPLLPFWGALIFFTVLVYLNSMHGEFHFDDKQHILENESIRSLSNWKSVLKAEYRGILWFTFLLNYLVSGYETFGWHVVNLGLHLANGLLIFSFLRKIFNNSSIFVPFFATLLFLIHPIQTESVSYISSRSELLVSFFIMLGFFFWNRHREGSRKTYVWFTKNVFYAFICYAASLWTKENALVFAILLSFYEWYFPDSRDRFFSFTQKILRLWPFFFLFALWWVLRFYLQQGTLGNQDAATIPQANTYIWTQARVVVRYLLLLLTPIGQNLDPDFPLSHSWREPWVIAATTFHASLLTLALFLRKKMPQIGFGILWFYILLGPSSSFIALRDAMSEHRVYLASLGFFWIFAYVLEAGVGSVFGISETETKGNRFSEENRQRQLASKFVPKWTWALLPVTFFSTTYLMYFSLLSGLPVFSKHFQIPWQQGFSFVVGIALLFGAILSFAAHRFLPSRPMKWSHLLVISFALVYGVMTIQRNLVYQNGITMWGDVIAKSPNKARPHYNLGNAYFNADQFDTAIKYYTKATSIDPDYLAPYFNRGNTYNRLGKLKDALQDYEQTIRIEPKFFQGWYNRGVVLQAFGQKAEAIESYKRVLEIRPNYMEAYNSLGVIYFQDGDFERAIRYFSFILKRDPRNFEALINTALSLFNLKRTREALPYYATAVKVAPKNPRAWLSYALCLSELGENPQMAQAALERALSLYPDYGQNQQFIEVRDKVRGQLARK